MVETRIRTALVTGGSRGIGRAIVERLVRDGTVVVFSYVRDEDAATQLVNAVEGSGARTWAVQADHADPGAPEALFDTAERDLGGIDVLVNNAAADIRPAPLAETRDEDYDRMMAVNTRAVFALLRQAAARLRDGGRIINISTLNRSLALFLHRMDLLPGWSGFLVSPPSQTLDQARERARDTSEATGPREERLR